MVKLPKNMVMQKPRERFQTEIANDSYTKVIPPFTPAGVAFVPMYAGNFGESVGELEMVMVNGTARYRVKFFRG